MTGETLSHNQDTSRPTEGQRKDTMNTNTITICTTLLLGAITAASRGHRPGGLLRP